MAGGVAGGQLTGDDWPASEAGAEAAHEAGVTGLGISVAVVGGGWHPLPEVLWGADGHARLLALVDARSTSEGSPVAGGGVESADASHLLTVAFSSRRDQAGSFLGVAPNADLVLVTALGPDGRGSPRDVARGIDWVVANRDRYGIRVLHLPLAARARLHWWEGPVGLAAARAWWAGIVVVAPAGNGGPAPATVAAPGDVPGIITVGAAAPGPEGPAIASYSAAGPTLAGFAKPELQAPGPAAAAAPMPAEADVVRAVGDGTALASSRVSGAVALLLEAKPWLAPDEVKRLLLASARPLAAAETPAAAGRWRAGLVDAGAAIAVPAGATWPAASGSAEALRGYTWSDGALRGYTWSDGALRGYTWSDGAFRGYTWSDAAVRRLGWPD